MVKLRYVHWQDDDFRLGYLEDYPDYVTQGGTLQELVENLTDLYGDIASGEVAYIRRIDELVVNQ